MNHIEDIGQGVVQNWTSEDIEETITSIVAITQKLCGQLEGNIAMLRSLQAEMRRRSLS